VLGDLYVFTPKYIMTKLIPASLRYSASGLTLIVHITYLASKLNIVTEIVVAKKYLFY